MLSETLIAAVHVDCPDCAAEAAHASKFLYELGVPIFLVLVVGLTIYLVKQHIADKEAEEHMGKGRD